MSSTIYTKEELVNLRENLRVFEKLFPGAYCTVLIRPETDSIVLRAWYGDEDKLKKVTEELLADGTIQYISSFDMEYFGDPEEEPITAIDFPFGSHGELTFYRHNPLKVFVACPRSIGNGFCIQ